MRVLALSHSSVVGAYRGKFRLLARRRAWELHLALPHAWPEGGSAVAAPVAAREGALKLHVLPGRLSGRVGFATLGGLRELALRLRPDLVYAEEEPYSLGAYQALRAAHACGARFAFYTWENMDRRYKPPLNWVRRRVLARADGAVVGNADGEALLGQWGWRGPLLRQPQYGIDMAAFKPLRAQRRPFCAGYFGRLVPEKGVDLLVRACAKAGLRLRIGGQGPEEGRLRALAGALKADVAFEGFVPFARRQAFYGRIDALALPSLSRRDWKEQFGRVLAEAMACGLPCVGSDSGAIPEVLGPGGLVVPEGDADALARALKRLAASAALRRRLGAAGRARARLNFDTRVLVAGLGRFLEGVVRAR
jgi:glycosyltransferase involved in cell wall biosynthesis